MRQRSVETEECEYGLFLTFYIAFLEKTRVDRAAEICGN